MKSSIIESLVSIIEFIAIAMAAFILAPYLITAEHYDNAGSVRSSFPIAIIENGQPSIVRWDAYRKSPEKYTGQLVMSPYKDSMTSALLAGNERFVIKRSGDNNYQLTYYADDYTFWSEYSIVDGIVRPSYFRFNGAFIVFPVLVIALLGTVTINWVVKRYFSRRSRKTH
jgi:hypothetical protein